MKDREENIGKWFDPLLTTEERNSLRNEIPADELENLENIWRESKHFSPPDGVGSQQRLDSIEKLLDEEAVVVPMYRTTTFRAAIGALVAASLLFGMLFILKPGESVLDQHYVSQTGERKSIQLPDGSTIQLNASSEIKYSSEDWHKERVIVLNGEAFFEVTKSNTPFVVRAENLTVTVLGTSFNVRNRTARSTVSCITGKVSVSNKAGSKVMLTKGLETAINQGELLSPYDVDVHKVTSWVNGEFYFEDKPLSEVFEEVERQFGVVITSELEFKSLNFNGSFADDELDKSLSIICLSAGLKYEVEGNSVRIFNPSGL